MNKNVEEKEILKGEVEVESKKEEKFEVKVSNQVLPSVNINYEELKKQIEEITSLYVGKEVTKENYKAIKKDCTALNKGAKKLTSMRREISKQMKSPIVEMENKFKELEKMFSSTREELLTQVENFDNEERKKKEEFAKEYIKESFVESGLKEKYRECIIFKPEFSNLSITKKKVKEDIDNQIKTFLEIQNKEELATLTINETLEKENERLANKMEFSLFSDLVNDFINDEVSIVDIVNKITQKADSLFENEERIRKEAEEKAKAEAEAKAKAEEEARIKAEEEAKAKAEEEARTKTIQKLEADAKNTIENTISGLNININNAENKLAKEDFQNLIFPYTMGEIELSDIINEITQEANRIFSIEKAEAEAKARAEAEEKARAKAEAEINSFVPEDDEVVEEDLTDLPSSEVLTDEVLTEKDLARWIMAFSVEGSFHDLKSFGEDLKTLCEKHNVIYKGAVNDLCKKI